MSSSETERTRFGCMQVAYTFIVSRPILEALHEKTGLAGLRDKEGFACL